MPAGPLTSGTSPFGRVHHLKGLRLDLRLREGVAYCELLHVVIPHYHNKVTVFRRVPLFPFRAGRPRHDSTRPPASLGVAVDFACFHSLFSPFFLTLRAR